MLQRGAVAGLHLRTLNPNVAALSSLPALFTADCLALSESAKKTGGLSSFGFGGTNAHGVLSEVDTGVPARTAPTVPTVYNRRSFPWREVGYRMLRARPTDASFEVVMNADMYDVVKHHVVFGSIVVPGVVYGEMALEATRELFGHKAQLTNMSMVFPFVIPVRTTGAEPSAVMRFVLKSNDTKFEIQSTSATGAVTTHAEGGIDKFGAGKTGEVPPQDLEALKARITEPVKTEDVYGAIHRVGLYLGPQFQVLKEVWRIQEGGEAPEFEKNEVLGKLQLDKDVPNVGHCLHPALFDGTIHTLGTASIGHNVNDLKIFGGVSRIRVVQEQN